MDIHNPPWGYTNDSRARWEAALPVARAALAHVRARIQPALRYERGLWEIPQIGPVLGDGAIWMQAGVGSMPSELGEEPSFRHVERVKLEPLPADMPLEQRVARLHFWYDATDAVI